MGGKAWTSWLGMHVPELYSRKGGVPTSTPCVRTPTWRASTAIAAAEIGPRQGGEEVRVNVTLPGTRGE